MHLICLFVNFSTILYVEVAAACLFLASDESSYVNCACLDVTGKSNFNMRACSRVFLTRIFFKNTFHRRSVTIMRKRQKRLASHGDESLPELRYRRRWGPSKALSKSSMLKFYIRENLFKVVMLSGIEQLGVNNLCL